MRGAPHNAVRNLIPCERLLTHALTDTSENRSLNHVYRHDRKRIRMGQTDGGGVDKMGPADGNSGH